MSQDIESAARKAGLTDMDLLRVARPGLSPEQAVDDLRGRYPSAFKATVRDLPEADYRQAKQSLIQETWRSFQQKQDDAWLKAAEAKYGVRKPVR